MQIERVLPLAASALPLVVLTALGVAATSNEGRPDAYAFGVAIVALGCAGVECLERWRGTARALWVLAMPMVAGASTGFALALLHPKRDGLEALFGGAGIGAIGGVVLFPGLIVAAVIVQGWVWGWARALTRRGLAAGSAA